MDVCSCKEKLQTLLVKVGPKVKEVINYFSQSGNRVLHSLGDAYNRRYET